METTILTIVNLIIPLTANKWEIPSLGEFITLIIVLCIFDEVMNIFDPKQGKSLFETVLDIIKWPFKKLFQLIINGVQDLWYAIFK